ncbi:MAG TPA: NAD-dependent protein deacylase [Candidatus Omnitrophota bacterium]|nr:NAD-dependent protein deacylase [Candidatus Omnitrophota bacterium]
MDVHETIHKVAELLKKSKSILFITGAGVSADSGLPTYRGLGGLYDDVETEDGIPIEMALAGDTLRKRPEVTWKYLSQVEQKCRGARPNRAHEIIAEMERRFERVWVLTQNIDSFHHVAGSRNVIDIHGDMHDIQCEECGWKTRVENYDGLEIPPRCPKCDAIVRPDVVFFGECLQPGKVRSMEREIGRPFDVYFSIGTTSVFPYIKHPMILASHLGRPTIEINPDTTDISGWVDIRIPMGAAVALDALWQELAAP